MNCIILYEFCENLWWANFKNSNSDFLKNLSVRFFHGTVIYTWYCFRQADRYSINSHMNETTTMISDIKQQSMYLQRKEDSEFSCARVRPFVHAPGRSDFRKMESVFSFINGLIWICFINNPKILIVFTSGGPYRNVSSLLRNGITMVIFFCAFLTMRKNNWFFFNVGSDYNQQSPIIQRVRMSGPKKFTSFVFQTVSPQNPSNSTSIDSMRRASISANSNFTQPSTVLRFVFRYYFNLFLNLKLFYLYFC